MKVLVKDLIRVYRLGNVEVETLKFKPLEA